MNSLVILSLLLVLRQAASVQQFSWRDCASDQSTTKIKVYSIDVGTAMPIVFPGPFVLSFNSTIKQDMATFFLDFTLERQTGLLGSTKIKIPCVDNIGSCVYDACAVYQKIISGQSTAISQSLGQQVNAMLEAAVHHNITCPIHPEAVVVQNYTLQLGALPSALSVFADGDYTVTIKVKDLTSGDIYGCLELKASIKRKKTSFLFG